MLDGPSAHTLAGDVDTYALSTTVALPPRVTGVRYDLTGPARFPADAATGCDTSQDGGTLRCPEVLDQAEVDMRIAATSLTDAADVTVTVAPLDTITDTTEGDQTESVGLLPGADLGLDLDVTSANPDRNARVALGGTLTGVRNGLDRVRYTLSGDAVLPPGANPGCTPTATNKAISCPAPSDGTVALVVQRTSPPRTPADVTVAVAPEAPFEAVGTGSHSDDVTLPTRPTHAFAMGPLTETAHTVTGNSDTYTLRSTVSAIPAGSGSLSFVLASGGSFADAQGAGCDRVDATHVTCGDLATDRAVDFRVVSTSAAAHDTTIGLEVPEPYDDPDESDNERTVGVVPGTHLVLTPHNLGSLHQDSSGGYPVTASLAGVRSGVPSVVYTLTGPRRSVRRPRLCPVGRDPDLPGCHRRRRVARHRSGRWQRRVVRDRHCCSWWRLRGARRRQHGHRLVGARGRLLHVGPDPPGTDALR